MPALKQSGLVPFLIGWGHWKGGWGVGVPQGCPLQKVTCRPKDTTASCNRQIRARRYAHTLLCKPCFSAISASRAATHSEACSATLWAACKGKHKRTKHTLLNMHNKLILQTVKTISKTIEERIHLGIEHHRPSPPRREYGQQGSGS